MKGQPCGGMGLPGKNVADASAAEEPPNKPPPKLYCTGTAQNYECHCGEGRKYRDYDYGCTTAADDIEIDKCKNSPGNQNYYAPGFGCQTKASFDKIKDCETPGSGNHYTSGVLGGHGVCLDKYGHSPDTPQITQTKEREMDWPKFRNCMAMCVFGNALDGATQCPNICGHHAAGVPIPDHLEK